MTKEVTRGDLLKVNSELTNDQIKKFFTQTPKDKIKTRPAKGGGTWDYVAGSYVTQVLNSLFGFNWSFEIVTSMAEAMAVSKSGTVVVQGKLKVKIGDEWITKEQYGRKEVTYKKGTQDPLDFGNDMKAAATDAKKKCASELGLFADVYSKEDFFEATIVDNAEDSAPITIAIKNIEDTNTSEQLKEVFMALKGRVKVNTEVIAAKDKRKKELENESN